MKPDTNQPSITIELDAHDAGQIIRQMRKQKGILLKELAGELGVSSPMLCDMEKGFRHWSVARFEQAKKFIAAHKSTKSKI